jgi:hypothetical protein
MAITEAFTNSASISTTEYSLPNNSTSLTPITDDGVYQTFIDLANMAAGDQYEIKLYEKVTSGGTQRLVDTWIVTGAQPSPAFTLPSFILLHGWDVTMKRLAGSDRTIGWSIRKVA